MMMRDRQPSRPHGRGALAAAIAPRLVALGLLPIAALLLGEALGIRPAAAQARCGDRAEVIERLDRLYLERPQAIGLSADGRLLEVLVSSSGSWTILVTDGNRTSCVIAVGEDWESVWAASAEFGA